MERKIKSVKILKSKYSTTIYVNFDNCTFATHSKEDGKWIDSGFCGDELAQAKAVALVDNKWTNYTAPRTAETTTSMHYHKDEEQLDAEAERGFAQRVTFASQTDKEQ